MGMSRGARECHLYCTFLRRKNIALPFSNRNTPLRKIKILVSFFYKDLSEYISVRYFLTSSIDSIDRLLISGALIVTNKFTYSGSCERQQMYDYFKMDHLGDTDEVKL